MAEFVLLFRMDITTAGAQPTPEQMRAYMQQWQHWISGLTAQGSLAQGGNHFSTEGRVISNGSSLSAGPYIDKDSNSVAGYILIKANNLDQATELAKSCPILAGEGNSVEVRPLASPGGNG